MNYLMNTLKVSVYGLLWGFPVPIILALLLNRIRKEGIKKKIQLLIYAPNFILSYCTLWYGSYVFITNRTNEQDTRHQHKLDDNAGCIQDNLHSERHLAGRRLGFNHVHSGIIQCEQGA